MRAVQVVCGLVVLLSPAAQASGLERLVPHRAVYEVTLDEASERSGISGIKGRMVYESRGAACDGFSVRFRFFQNVRTPRREYSSDQRTTSFESGDGKRYEFVNRTFFNGSLEREVKGSAVRGDAGVAVALTQPDERAVELPAAIFPGEHMGRILEAAVKGRRVLATDVFDGSDEGDAVTATNAIIGRPREPQTTGKASDGVGTALGGLTSWPVTVAYFEGAADASGERTPVYQVSFPLYENGVSGDLTMRYEDYTLKGELSALEYLDPPDCAPR